MQTAAEVNNCKHLNSPVGQKATMVDVPDGLDDLKEVIVFGVESEQIEEENDAYNDLRAELGLYEHTFIKNISFFQA